MLSRLRPEEGIVSDKVVEYVSVKLVKPPHMSYTPQWGEEEWAVCNSWIISQGMEFKTFLDIWEVSS